MVGHSLTFIFTVFVWWASTGAVLMLSTLPSRTFGWSLVGGSIAAIAAFYGLHLGGRDTGSIGTYLSFLSAIIIWGWLEMGFLMGFVTGPRTTPCPADATGWRRFRLAIDTLLYRHLAIIVSSLAVIILTKGQVNQTGLWTFMILLVMRVSAELNIFLGVPYLPDALLPERLCYLKSYFRTRRLNFLFPISILGAGLVAFALAERALGSEGAEAAGAALMFALLALAILEHFFMVMPVGEAALWRWARNLAAAKPIEKPSN